MKYISNFKRSLSGLDGSSWASNSNFEVRYPVVPSYNCYLNKQSRWWPFIKGRNVLH